MITVLVLSSNSSTFSKICLRAEIVNGPSPFWPLLLVGHRFGGSLRNSDSQLRKARNGFSSRCPARMSSAADLSFRTTVHVQQPNRPDAQGGATGDFMIGHSPDAPRYNCSKRLLSSDLGDERPKMASQTSGTPISTIGKNRS